MALGMVWRSHAGPLLRSRKPPGVHFGLSKEEAREVLG